MVKKVKLVVRISATLFAISIVFPINIYYNPISIVAPNFNIINNNFFLTYVARVIENNPIPLLQMVEDRDRALAEKEEELRDLNRSISELEVQKDGRVNNLNGQINALEQQVIGLEGDVNELRSRLDVATVVVSGTARTSIGIQAVVFESDGVIVSSAEVRDGRYVTMLSNYKVYSVSIEYIGIMGRTTCKPANSVLSLDLQTPSHTQNLSC